MLCGSLLWLTHLWSPLKMLLQALDGTAMWCFLLELIMSFLCTVFSWAFPSYMLKFDFSLLLSILFGC
jgi:hypothetical protein